MRSPLPYWEKKTIHLLVYHAILYRDYQLPVISIIIYPFRTTMAKSPFVEMSGNDLILMLNFGVLPLFSLDAEYYIQQHVACMYPLLPTMSGVTPKLIEEAAKELIELYVEDEVSLAQQLIWMALLLERTDMLTPEEKQDIQRSVPMYDTLWENHPKVKEIKALAQQEVERSVREGILKAQQEARQVAERAIREAQRVSEKKVERAEQEARRKVECAEQEAKQDVERAKQDAERAKQDAALQTSRNIAVMLVKRRFPALAEQAWETLAEIATVDALNILIVQITAAPDEATTRWLLSIVEA